MDNITPLILCGGVGKRLWPFSTPARPKPFLKWGLHRSMLQKTLLRVQHCAAPILVANAGLKPLLLAQLSENDITASQIILEPMGRNTAPALAAAALFNPEALLLVLPCDHAIGNPEILLDAISRYKTQALQGSIIAFGVRPRYAEGGFGYIAKGQMIADGLYKIDLFVEKPSKNMARQLIKTGHYDWNSGIFLLSAATALEELARFEPVLLQAVRSAVKQADKKGNTVFLGAEFAAAPPLSIDVAVMERSDKTLTVPLALDWHDLGTFPALFRMFAKKTFGLKTRL